MTNTIAVLRDFLVNDSNQPVDEAELDRSSDLLEEGILDSLSLMVLVDFLSERYSIEFDADEVIPRNFKSLEAIATLVDGKVEGRG
jgi:acyl carrier protein